MNNYYLETFQTVSELKTAVTGKTVTICRTEWEKKNDNFGTNNPGVLVDQN